MKQVEFAKMMDSLISRGAPFAVATVVKTEGSSLGKPGFKVIISSAGAVLYGTLGGVCPESAIVSHAKKTMRTGSPKIVKVFLESVENSLGAVLKSQNEDEVHVETNCGGTMEIYIEPYLPQQRLILIGQGGKDDIENALLSLGKSLDYDVVVIDHAPVLSEQPDQLIQDVDYDLASFPFSSSDSVVVLTHGDRDVEILQKLSRFKLRYVGMLASRQRARDGLANLMKTGAKEQFVASIRTPIGADIGAVTAPEIALSVMAEVVAAKYGKEVVRKTLDEKPRPKEIES